jgi:cytochrome P450
MIAAYRGRNPVQSYFAARADPIAFLSDIVRDCGDFAQFRILTQRYMLVNDPGLVKEALIEHSDTLVIAGGASAGLARLIGHGILTNRGDDWRASRSKLQPLFNQTALKASLPTLRARVSESVERWRTGFRDKPVPIQRELLALWCRMTCSTLFGYLPSFEEADEFAEAIAVLQRDGMERYTAGGDLLPWLPSPQNRRIARAKAALEILAKKAATGSGGTSLDDILSIFFAGTESPVNTICFALKLLEEHPSWLAQLRDGVAPSASWEDLERFDAMAQVMSEALRLYPAGWAFERVAAEDVWLGGERVAKGTRLLFSPYVLHRNPRFWRESERFDPTRFSTNPNSALGVPKFGYLPFGAGPRSCIGARMAIIEMRLVLEALVSTCRWMSETGKTPLSAEGSFKIRLSRPLLLNLQVV